MLDTQLLVIVVGFAALATFASQSKVFNMIVCEVCEFSLDGGP